MDLNDPITHWGEGVITSAEQDRPELRNAMIRADNAMFTSIAGGQAQVRKRLGVSLVNSTVLSAEPIVFGFGYIYNNAGNKTPYTLVVTESGDVHLLEDDGATTSLTPSASFASLFNTGLTQADAAKMNERLFVLDGKGGQASFKDSAQVAWGVTPATIDSLVQTGVGSMTGDYDILVTVWDSEINAESNRSEVSSTSGMAAEQLQVVVDSVPVTETHLYFRVYLRKASIGPGFYRVLAGTGFVGGTIQGFPLSSAGATVNTTINVSDATLEDLILEPPKFNAHGLPPSDVKYVAVWQRRLFVANDTTVYWSELDKPDAFNPLSAEPIISPAGGILIGLIAFDNQLQIFTESARHTLSGGADIKTWVWDIPDPEVGAISRSSITIYNKKLFWWNQEHGPIMMTPGGDTIHIGSDRIREDVRPTRFAPSLFHRFAAAGLDGRVLFSTVEVGMARAQRIFSYHVEKGVWESTRWNPLPAATIFTSMDSDQQSYIYIGGYNGQLFRMQQGGSDGVRDGTHTGTFVAATESVTTIEDLTATFDTLGAGLVERQVVLLDAEGLVVNSNTPYITANTATEFTLSESMTDLIAGATYTYVIGGPNFRFESYWSHMNQPFTMKRFDWLYIELRADDGVTRVVVNTAFNWDPLRDSTTTIEDISTELWDSADWDVSFWDDQATLQRRISIIQRGLNYRIQIRNPFPDQGFTLLKTDVDARAENRRLI